MLHKPKTDLSPLKNCSILEEVRGQYLVSKAEKWQFVHLIPIEWNKAVFLFYWSFVESVPATIQDVVIKIFQIQAFLRVGEYSQVKKVHASVGNWPFLI